jgi:hypothetical protein
MFDESFRVECSISTAYFQSYGLSCLCFGPQLQWIIDSSLQKENKEECDAHDYRTHLSIQHALAATCSGCKPSYKDY